MPDKTRIKPASFPLLVVLTAIGACIPGPTDPEEDLRAIEALNQHDVDAVLSSDFDALISQWTEDFVLIPRVPSYADAARTPH